jgi:hypothetical protein
LLERTPEHEQAVRSVHRRHYLSHMARRFEVATDKPLPSHLRATSVLGVDYIFGHAESTGGRLWVVGRDPDLFTYFLPERWRRTPKEALSQSHQVFKTRTKDNINLVWRISRVGDTPWLRGGERARELLDHGFNCPFEEFAHALDMGRAGMRTIYPRAIYMTGHKGQTAADIADRRRFADFVQLLSPDGQPTLSEGHEYITVWGFWNGPDELLASQDGAFYRGINLEQARAQGLIEEPMIVELLTRTQRRLERAGFEDLNLEPDHLLISVGPDNQLVLDTMGKPELRLCNFEFVRRIAKP